MSQKNGLPGQLKPVTPTWGFVWKGSATLWSINLQTWKLPQASVTPPSILFGNPFSTNSSRSSLNVITHSLTHSFHGLNLQLFSECIFQATGTIFFPSTLSNYKSNARIYTPMQTRCRQRGKKSNFSFTLSLLSTPAPGLSI